jgi:thiamine monophosphate synthase
MNLLLCPLCVRQSRIHNQAKEQNVKNNVRTFAPLFALLMLLLARVGAAIAGGATAIQYRNKRAAAALRREQARSLRQLCAAHNVIFIVNDDADLRHLDGHVETNSITRCHKAYRYVH